MYYGKNKMKYFYLTSLICILGFPFTTIHAKAYKEKDVYTAYEKLINYEHNADEKYKYEKINGGPNSGNRLYGKAGFHRPVCVYFFPFSRPDNV